MVTKKKTKSGIEYETSSGNVFADIGLDDADELFARSMLAIQIKNILDEQGIKKQKDIAELWGVDKTEVSKFMHGDYQRFSQERLFGFLNKLNYKAVIQIAPMQKGDRPQEVVMM